MYGGMDSAIDFQALFVCLRIADQKAWTQVECNVESLGMGVSLGYCPIEGGLGV